MTIDINKQDRGTIQTLHYNPVCQAIIFSEEQRATIKRLISHKFIPHHSSVGTGKAGNKHWRLEKYRGRFGKGFKMITTSPYSSNFNHLTYFTVC